MKMKRILTALLTGPLMWAFAAQAGTTTFRGVSVDYGNASASWAGDELVLTYGNVGEDTLKLGGAVKTDVLLVGGGGSGSSGGSSSSKQGYGGGGGEVVARSGVTLSGESAISVGSGGAAVKSSSKFSRTSGISGGKTTIGGALDLAAAGGSAGGGSGVSGQGTVSDISGASVTYGADGGSRTSSSASVDGAANTGNGGSGGYAGVKSGAGGSGVVIVRLKAAYASVTLADMTLGQGEEVASFSEKAAGAPVDIFFSEVSEVSFSPEGVAQAMRTKEGRLTLVGVGPGETTVTIVKETDTVIYTAKVTVTAPIKLNDLTIQRDETAAALVREDTDEPIDLNYDDAKALKSSVPEIADFVKLPNGKLGVAGKLPGTVDMMIIAEGQSYLFTVMVESLLSGLYKVGAYEVAVSNASDISYVDGDLVLIYRDVDVNIKKSFELPKATTGRLLAVGGGGAGGQDAQQDYDANYGLPGGGGAGGLVINDAQAFIAAKYGVEVGTGGVAFGRKLTTLSDTKTWVPTAYGVGNNGANTVVRQGTTAIVTAKGGGGGGRRSPGNAGGNGGGGSADAAYNSKSRTYDLKARDGGEAEQEDGGYGFAGGAGSNAKFGAGGGGAGGPGGDTTQAETNEDPTKKNIDGSGAGGPGRLCDITGEMLEYARGGAGGVPRVYPYYYYKKGVCYYTKKQPSDSDKKSFDGGKYFWCEASDGKPGRDGFGDGGGGSGHYSSNPTFAGRGGNGAVIVRIPPYKTTVEDALKAAFADQPVTVSGSSVTLNGDATGPICLPDNLGAVTINLDGYKIVGVNGADGDDITPGGDGQPALTVVPHTYASEANAVTEIRVTGSGSLQGGNGGTGYPGGAGAAAVAADGCSVASGIAVTAGVAGESLVQHPHKWAYAVEDGKIIAYCVADDGEPCSYRDHSRGPFVAISAADAAYTAMRYDELTSVNGITPVTGIVVAPETYVGRDGTDYPESSTPPREQGAYTVSMRLGDLKITSDFAITEQKAPQGSVYQAWKTAERKGRDVQIALSATFDGSKAINDGNVLFLGSRCKAHSMAEGTVESSVNAMTRYANVRWYAYGSSDPDKNLVNQLTKKGEKVAANTVTLVGANHFVHKEMMDDLYAELVEKKNRADGYDLLILEFDGDLLCREGYAPYQLNYRLPEGWTDEKAARLRAAMSRYYAEDRVVWIVPDVNQPKSDAGYTGEYPWTSNPEFIWQRAFLNATETEGYRCPLQKNYEDADELVDYLQEVLVGHFFSNAIIEDTLANGLTIKKVTPQMRSDGGIWRNFEGTTPHYTIPEPRSGTTVKADVEQVGRKVTVTFDMKEEQAWACEHDQVIGDDFRVVIDAELDGFFSVGEGEWQETNEGPATFTFTESNLDDDDEDFTITIEKDSPKIQNVKLTPDYASEDVVRIYDGKGTNIVVKPIAPTLSESVIRYSLDEHGTYLDALTLTDVCDKTKVWFTITDKSGEFNAATNFATVTILPRVVVEQAEDATKTYDGSPLKQPAHSNVLSRAIAEAEKMYPGQGASAAGFVTGEGFVNVPMTADSQQTEVGSRPNTIDKNAVTVNDKTDKNNYVFIFLPGTLTVTPPLPMGIAAFPVEKFYDAEATNVTWVVTNSTGAAIADATISLRVKGTDPWIPAADFAQYVDTTNVTVQVRAEKTGFTAVEAEATVLVKPRPVTLVAGSAEKVYDGTPLTCDTFTVKEDTATPGYGFVKEEGVASVTMTDESTITLPGSKQNEIASETAKAGTKLERNYVVTTEPGTLTVTAAAMGIAAFPVEKFYDAEPTNIAWVVTNAAGGVISDATISLREKGTDPWIPAADFARYVDTTNVTVEVRAEKAGFTPVTAEATVLVKPRPVILVAGSAEKVYDGLPLTCDDFEVKEDDTTPGYGFVKEEGVASVTMTPASTITDPGTQANAIASETAKEGTKLERNYVVSTEPGTLTVTAATMGIAAIPVEKFYDAEPTNVTWVVTNATGGVVSDATITLREQGTTDWIPVADFAQYVDRTNVTVQVRAEKAGFTPVTAEATVLVKPRPVTLIAGSDSKTYDGTPLTCDDFEVKEDDTTPGYGFVGDEGVASVTMTPESTITNTGSQPNVIASETAKEGTKLERNYVVSTEPGTLTVTDASMGIAAFPVEKFYDAEPTNVSYVVTNAAGAAITDATISLREKGTDPWIPVADFARYVDTTNVTVEVKAEKTGFTSVTAEATVVVKPRPVTLVAGSAEKVYDGTPLTCDTFTVKEDTATEGYGFVKEEGVALVAMTPASTITDPGSVPNVIASETAKAGTKLERNYVVTTEPGTLTVTAATMGIAAFPVEKFYDAEPTNITWTVTNATGAAITDATISLREKGTGPWIPVADFARYVDTTNATVEVKAEKTGFTSVTAEATVLVKPRPVTLVAGSDSKVYDGTPLTCDDFEVKDDDTTAAIPGYGFVKEEGVASVTMTPESTVTDPGSVSNEIASETAKAGTKLERNYVVTTEPGTLTVTAAAMGIAAFPVEKFYDAEPTNVSYVVTNAAGAAITDATISLRVKGTDPWIPAADFVRYVDTTNVTVEVKAEKTGFTPVTAEATVVIKPRPVTLVAGSAEKVYDGEPLTCDDFTVKTDTATEGYGFVNDEGVASVTMTPESTVTEPGAVPNVIATTVAKPDTKLERNYVVSTEPGTLTVTAATFTASAEPVEKFYDSVPTNIIVTVSGVPSGVTPTYEYSYSETEGYVPAADFTGPTNVSESAEIYCRVIIPGMTNVVHATATIKPRIVVNHAKDGEWAFDGTEHAQPEYYEDTADEAERSMAKWGTEEALPNSTGFVTGEGYAARLAMTDASKITDPGSVPNEIDTAADKVALKDNTKPENYELYYLDGTLTVTAAAMGIAAFPVEKFYDAEATNITWTVTNAAGAAITDATISLREKGTGPWIPAAEFPQYLNATNVVVEVKAEKTGYESATDSAAVLIKPRIVVVHAKDGEWTFDGAVHTQPEYEEDTDVEDTLSKAKWGTDEVLPDSVGFVEGEGYAAELAMTADSAITEPGTTNNVIDRAADKVALAANTRPENYELYYLDGLLTVWQREEEVRRDPEDQQKIEELPEETKNKIREADEKLVNDLKELEEKDVALQDEPFVKYQITVTPKEKLTEQSRTTPEIAETAVAAQEQLVPSADESVYVDITLERTTSKEEVKATDDGNYDKTKWESLDDADAHGRTEILAVTIPLDVPDGMELESVTRSCAGETDRLLPLSPGQEGTSEGFVYDPETKTVTIHAKDFCLFGFHLKAKGIPFNNLCERPLVYDFKASVRHMTLKEVKVNVRGIFNGTVYAKVRKASSLKGYLVVDRAGATSQAVVTGRGTDYNNIPASGMDYGRNRAFLVVRNASAEKAMRKPKILPAVLDAKWIARKSAADSGLAEGYLYVGGDSVAGVRPSLAGTPGALMLADYAWTSVYLFGQYNGPRWYVDGVLDQSELAINAAQPPDLQIRKGGVAVTPYPTYHDTWMNCAGFGKFFVPSTKKKACCGQANWISCGALPAEPTLSTLSGTLKGGLFLCSESGIVATGSNYETLDGGIWEDQFATARLVPADDFAPDAFQTDLWQDGPAALETTDVLYGNWSIKIRQNGLPDTQITDQGKDSLLAAAEMDALAFGANVRASGLGAKAYPLKHHVEAATGLYVLVGTLKAAVLKLDETATFIKTPGAGNDGEIWSLRSGNRLATPVLTPRFAQYFGLANFW